MFLVVNIVVNLCNILFFHGVLNHNPCTFNNNNLVYQNTGQVKYIESAALQTELFIGIQKKNTDVCERKKNAFIVLL